MQQFMEFAGNHPLLVAAFFAVLIFLLVSEILQRRSGVSTLSPAQAVAFMNRNDAVILDLSPAADYNKGHIVGARKVDMARIKDPDPALKKVLNQPILVTCKTGQTAGQAAAALKRHGATDVAVVKGGMTQWLSDNFPVTRD